jgi:hypothetical protein
MKFRYAFFLLVLSLGITTSAQNPAQYQPPQPPQHQDQSVVTQTVAIPRYQIVTTSYDGAGGNFKTIILLDNQTGDTWQYSPGFPTIKADGTKGFVYASWMKIER